MSLDLGATGRAMGLNETIRLHDIPAAELFSIDNLAKLSTQIEGFLKIKRKIQLLFSCT
jgi:hypothetical protein